MVIQEILLNERIHGGSPLYYRGYNVTSSTEGLHFKKGGKADFLTFFNLCNTNKWKTYTDVDVDELRLELDGEFIVILKKGKRTVVREVCRGSGTKVFPLPCTGKGDVISFTLEALSEGILEGGTWQGRVKDSKDQPHKRVGIVICTYKREKYVKQTLNTLQHHLPEGWGVCVVDNGRTLDSAFQEDYDKRFSFYPNPNTGGSGGFTRGLIELLTDSTSWDYTLLMDDDIVLEPGTLQRTAVLVDRLKPEYKDHFIAGSMLRMDMPTLQHEWGARWNGFNVRHSFHNLDLASSGDLFKNESMKTGKGKEYAAWWYCGIPLKKEMLQDLPLPLFLNGDDMEYSFRRSAGLIRLNGISVWHEPFQGKGSPVKKYLTVRNGLIINARTGKPLFKSLILVFGHYVLLLLKRKKTHIAYVEMALEHFLEGPDRVWTMCGPDIYSEVPESAKYENFGKCIRKIIENHRKNVIIYSNMLNNDRVWLHKVGEGVELKND